jgi:hypothetical protein
MGNTPVEGMGKTLIEGVENYPSTDMGKTLDISTFFTPMAFMKREMSGMRNI